MIFHTGVFNRNEHFCLLIRGKICEIRLKINETMIKNLTDKAAKHWFQHGHLPESSACILRDEFDFSNGCSFLFDIVDWYIWIDVDTSYIYRWLWICLVSSLHEKLQKSRLSKLRSLHLNHNLHSPGLGLNSSPFIQGQCPKLGYLMRITLDILQRNNYPFRSI